MSGLCGELVYMIGCELGVFEIKVEEVLIVVFFEICRFFFVGFFGMEGIEFLRCFCNKLVFYDVIFGIFGVLGEG